MDWSKTKFVCEFRDFDSCTNVADEVEAVFGWNACTVALGGASSKTEGTLYINTDQIPDPDGAYAYAKALIEAGCKSLDEYRKAIETMHATLAKPPSYR